MAAREVLEALRARGFVLRMDGSYLRVRPATKLEEDDRAAIRRFKPELLALLAVEERRSNVPPEDQPYARVVEEVADEDLPAERIALWRRVHRLLAEGALGDDRHLAYPTLNARLDVLEQRLCALGLLNDPFVQPT